MARTTRFSQVLWSLTIAWLAACGRVGFDPFGGANSGGVPDAGLDAAADAPPDTAPTDARPVGPVLMVMVPTMNTECGNVPDASSLTLANTGDRPLVIAKLTGTQNVVVTDQLTTAAVAVPSFTLQSLPLPMTIGPGTSARIDVIPPAAIVGTDVGGTIKTGSFTVETGAGMITQVNLAATVVGANLAITVPATTTINMVSSGCPSQTVTLANSGNATAQISVTVSSGLGLAGFTSGAIAQTRNTMVRAVTSSECSASGLTMQYQVVSGIVCQAPPSTLTVNYQINGGSPCSCS